MVDQPFSGVTAQAKGMAQSASGNIFIFGNTLVQNRVHWILRSSADGGVTWKTVDDYDFSDMFSDADVTTAVNGAPPNLGFNGDSFKLTRDSVAVDAQGNVFQAGTYLGKWIVRKLAQPGSH